MQEKKTRRLLPRATIPPPRLEETADSDGRLVYVFTGSCGGQGKRCHVGVLMQGEMHPHAPIPGGHMLLLLSGAGPQIVRLRTRRDAAAIARASPWIEFWRLTPAELRRWNALGLTGEAPPGYAPDPSREAAAEA